MPVVSCGKIYDKEIANYDKLLAKNKELKAQREQLAKTGVDDLTNKQIEQLNQKLDKQKEKLENIINLRERSAKALDILEKIYKKEFSNKFKTITFDNGPEFRKWKSLEKSYDNRKKKPRTQVYYAHPYCSGERGSNENGNRLIRRFIPKGTDITLISEEFIKYVENWINNYPRAMFNYKSTNQILEKLCA